MKSNILLETGTNELEIAEFQLKRILPDGSIKINYYGINVAKVREVIRFPEITDCPRASESIIGVFKSREDVTPLVHLAHWLRLGGGSVSDEQFVIVTDFNGVTNGFLIDSISRIHRISWSDLDASENLSFDSEQQCITASVMLEGKLLFILDFEKIISELNQNVNMGSYSSLCDPAIDMTKQSLLLRSQHMILVAEDSRFISVQIESVLTEAGYKVLMTKNGALAWDSYQAQSNTISAVVTDIEMPEIDGMHLCKLINSHKESTPTVVFSSTMTPENGRKAFSVGAVGTITKPNIHELVPMLDQLLITVIKPEHDVYVGGEQ